MLVIIEDDHLHVFAILKYLLDLLYEFRLLFIYQYLNKIPYQSRGWIAVLKSVFNQSIDELVCVIFV